MVWETDTHRWEPRYYGSFPELVRLHTDAACIGVDIPIGLRDDEEPRRCDRCARRLLGRPRGSSVFPAPQRSLLACASHAEANTQSKKRFGKGISQQAFGIFSKVFEVDQQMTPELQDRVVEIHPEVSFRQLANRGLSHSKRTHAGFDERRSLLVSTFGEHSVPTFDEAVERMRDFHHQAKEKSNGLGTKPPKRRGGPDDYLDAIVAAWTAHRWANCNAKRLPSDPELDARGLRMEIVY